MTTDSIAQYVRDWLQDERSYTLEKFGLALDDEHIQETDFAWWNQQFDNYLHRAQLLGLENAVGRQAFAKFVATAVGAMEAMVRIYGPLPKPGVPSGENIRDLREL